jgi:germination protein M
MLKKKETGMVKKRIRMFMSLLCLLGALTACGQQETEQEGKSYQIYCVSNDEAKLVSYTYQTQSEETAVLLAELLTQLETVPAKFEYEAPLDRGFHVVNYTLDNGLLTMDFDENYSGRETTVEILFRAAIVRTLIQVPGIEHVAFTVQGEPLMDSAGIAIGMMDADTFIENAGNEINAYEKVNLRLYFADETGNGLIEENQRNVVYNSNISLEKLVVERLIAGPQAEGDYPTINPETKIVSVTVKDGICYVNLSEAFLSQPYNVTSDVTIYSITNSLVELPNVNKVQISVNGETNLFYRENVNLATVFERNLDLLSSSQTEE